MTKAELCCVLSAEGLRGYRDARSPSTRHRFRLCETRHAAQFGYGEAITLPFTLAALSLLLDATQAFWRMRYRCVNHPGAG
jgi:hypothetical protein